MFRIIRINNKGKAFWVEGFNFTDACRWEFADRDAAINKAQEMARTFAGKGEYHYLVVEDYMEVTATLEPIVRCTRIIN